MRASNPFKTFIIFSPIVELGEIVPVISILTAEVLTIEQVPEMLVLQLGVAAILTTEGSKTMIKLLEIS